MMMSNFLSLLICDSHLSRSLIQVNMLSKKRSLAQRDVDELLSTGLRGTLEPHHQTGVDEIPQSIDAGCERESPQILCDVLRRCAAPLLDDRERRLEVLFELNAENL